MKRIEVLKRIVKEFGLGTGFRIAIAKVFGKTTYIKCLKKYLFKNITSKIVLENKSEENKYDKIPVFSLWFQGINAAPEVIQLCHESHLRYISSQLFDYYFITNENLHTFLDIPDFIAKKVQKGAISLTHFSDYIRVCLLEKFGGLWLDSTLLLTDNLKTDFFKNVFYSAKINGKPADTGQLIAERMWAGFLMGANCKHSLIFSYLKSALEMYWLEHNYPIDYFLLNLLLRLGYENNIKIKEEIDSLSVNNNDLYSLKSLFNNKFNKEQYDQLTSKTYIFKTTQKMSLLDFVDGEPTFYKTIKSFYWEKQ